MKTIEDQLKDQAEKLTDSGKLAKATFAGGCFWCMEPPFEELAGVSSVTSGYSGGDEPNPTYEEVGMGSTGHAEAIEITYNPEKVAYEELLEVFWRQIDPTDDGGQFVDRGSQYRTAIFYHDETQKKLAIASRDHLQKSGRYSKPILTEIVPLKKFYPAEGYHQDYYKKKPTQYKFYRSHSGRDDFLTQKWERKKLTPLQFEVTQKGATEPPFKNEYWDNKREGIYVDVASGEALFSSRDKFDSGTGWPSFTKPLVPKNIVEKEDRSSLMTRTEVKSLKGNSHLGHLFPDGPAPTGSRYCINSASLRFIPKEDLEKEGYGEFKKLLDQPR